MQWDACPNISEKLLRWQHFWNRQVYRRPVVMVEAVKDGIDPKSLEPIHERRYYDAVHGPWDTHVALLKRHVQKIDYLGDTVPMFSPDLGPDQWAAFFGSGEFKFNDSSLATNWVDPVIEDWQAVLPLRIDPANKA